jgi:hypothetical protein
MGIQNKVGESVAARDSGRTAYGIFKAGARLIGRSDRQAFSVNTVVHIYGWAYVRRYVSGNRRA